MLRLVRLLTMTMAMTMIIKTPPVIKPEGKTSFHCFWQEGRARGLRDMWLPSHFGPSQQTWWSSWWWWWWWWWWTWRRRQWWRCWTFLLWAKTPSWSSRRCAILPARHGLPLDHHDHNNNNYHYLNNDKNNDKTIIITMTRIKTWAKSTERTSCLLWRWWSIKLPLNYH